MRYQINKGSKAFGASIVFQDIQSDATAAARRRC